MKRLSNILGVFSIGPNPAACLLQEGRLVAMAEEERFERRKEIELVLPDHAIRYCLQEGRIGIEDVDCIAYGWNAQAYPWRMAASNVQRWLRHHALREAVSIPRDEHLFKFWIAQAELAYHHPAVIRQRLRMRWKGLPLPPVYFVPHHLAHAASVFFTSGLPEAALLTVDRNGEDKCTVLWRARGTTIEPVEEYRMPHSLGGFFTGFTDFLGFKPEYHEGKLMGLAAYGRPNTDLLRKMERVLTLVGPRAYALDPSFFLYGRNHGNTYSEKLTRLFGQPRHGPGEHIEQPYKDLAYAVQNRLEEALSRLVQRAVAGTGKRMLCIAGGVALNCLANGRIASSGLVDRLFVSPVSNDAGTALGAALWVAKVAGYDPRQEMLHPYWGPGYSDDEVCTKLEKMGIPYQRCEQIETVAAREIAEGKTVAWFQGRMEIGPRALGGRSILGDPRTTDMRDKLNRIKGREPWRPLAPVILEEAVPDYFAGSGGSPFMTIAAPVRAEKQALVPAVVHVDGTTRPQVVTRATDTRYRRLVEAFAALTGIPAVVNTSFNTQGEPIVCSVEDAVRTFFGSGLDLLVAGSAIVKKAPTDVTD